MYSPFTRWGWWYFTKYYNPKLGSDCNLGKDLSKRGENDQLVKHKNIELYLQLYIPIDYEEIRKVFLKKQYRVSKKNIRMSLLLYETLTDTIWERHKM